MTIEINQTEIDLVELAKAAMIARGFLTDFSSEVERELKQIGDSIPLQSENDIKDMRDKLWFSIDNDDSRDLDQITYVERLEDGKVKAFVAIADVSSTVKKGSAINARAEHNTTSVYTPTVIFPMLPEKLSTNLTSLNENEDRSAFVTEMDIDAQGVMQDYKIYRATVRNHAQLAYNAVGYWIEQNENPPQLIKENEELEYQVKTHDYIAQKMKGYRQSKGSLSLETLEPHAIIKNRIIIDIVEEKKNRAKEIIENFMVSANQAATKFLHAHDFPAFKRVVRVPKRWDKIVELAGKLGKSLPLEPDSKALEDFLVNQKNVDPVKFPDLSLAVVKLLGRGEYIVEYPGDENLGHFGLAIRNYSHSTAPNRRFPDVITQRMIREVLEGGKCPYTKTDLNKLAEHCTLKEGDADKVTRQTQKSAAAILLSSKIGQSFEGIVTGVSKDGTFVRVFTPPVEGKLVKGFEKVDVGDRVKVKLIAVDIKKGFIDFSIVD
jgi:exoribonuclease-2